MEIRMYECGFGDCFRLREANQVDLYVVKPQTLPV